MRNKLPNIFRYMFAFQWPLLPELMLNSDDAKLLENFAYQYAKHGTFSLEDIEAWKYTFATYSMYQH